MLVVEERVRVVAQVGLDAADGEVHRGKLPGGGVRLLAEHGDVVADASAVLLDELRALDEHAARAAAWVIHAAVEGLQDLDERPDDAARGVELAGQLALLLGELAEAVHVGLAQDVDVVLSVGELHVGEEVHDVAEPALVELRPCEVLREDVLEGVVLALDRAHCLVDHDADLGGVGVFSDGVPAGLCGHVEHTLLLVEVAVFLEAVSLLDELLVTLLEPV